MNIVIIEDNPNNMYLARFILEKRGHTVFGAVTAEDGIAQVRDACPDLILMDMNLPDMDGFEATRIIKSDAALESIPVIAFTALAMHGDADKTLAAGCDGYISKPLNPQTFADQVEAFV